VRPFSRFSRRGPLARPPLIRGHPAANKKAVEQEKCSSFIRFMVISRLGVVLRWRTKHLRQFGDRPRSFFHQFSRRGSASSSMIDTDNFSTNHTITARNVPTESSPQFVTIDSGSSTATVTSFSHQFFNDLTVGDASWPVQNRSDLIIRVEKSGK
jgi:hypothetical protein